MLSFTPLNTLGTRGENDQWISLQELNNKAIKLGRLEGFDKFVGGGGKTLVGNPPGLQRQKFKKWTGSCQYKGESYWIYQVKGYFDEKTDLFTVEAVRPVKSCLNQDDIDDQIDTDNLIGVAIPNALTLKH